MPRVGGRALLCGFYLNELLLKLLAREDPHPGLFATYEGALRELAAGQEQAPVLRRFELDLLAELGYALPLAVEADTGAPIDPAARYHYPPDRGPRSVGGALHAAEPHNGAPLLALHARAFPDGETAAEAKRLMREVLDHYLEQRGIESRRMVQDLQALVGERSDKA